MNNQQTSTPKYNMWQMTAWMIGIAWREHERKVLFYTPLAAILVAATNLVELFLVPSVLHAVESRVPIEVLCMVIVFFTAALMILRTASVSVFQCGFDARSSVRDILIGRYVEKTLTTAYPNVNSDRFSKLLSKAWINTFTDNRAAAAIWKTLTELLGNAGDILIFLTVLKTMNPSLLAVIAVTSAAGYIVTSRLHNYLFKHQEDVMEGSHRMRYSLNAANDQTAVKDMRLFGLRPWLDEMAEQAVGIYEAFLRKVFDRRLAGSIVSLILTFLRNGIAYVLLIRQVITGDLSLSGFVLLFAAVGGLSERMSGLMASFEKLYRNSIELNLLRELIEYPEPFCFEEGAALIPDQDMGYEIKLEHVSFRSPDYETDLLTDINLTLHSGEKIAIVGLNGTGKTTLVKLICGLLDPTQGRVLLNGRDIREFNRRDYYTLFSGVFQDFVTLPGTIALNVAQSAECIDMDRVKDCIAKAGLREKVESLPEGYNTNLNNLVFDDAITLSGGEMQRLMLARALYRNAPIVILDEPTSALDPLGEADIYMEYSQMTKGKTSVYVSHRLASTRCCDRILLLENAAVIESGTHEELLARGGKYAELFEVQRRYYREGGADHA